MVGCGEHFGFLALLALLAQGVRLHTPDPIRSSGRSCILSLQVRTRRDCMDRFPGRISRRSFVRLTAYAGLGTLASLAVACQQAPAPAATTAPAAKPTDAPKPTEAAKPATA